MQQAWTVARHDGSNLLGFFSSDAPRVLANQTGFSTVPKTMMCYKMHGSYHSGIFTTLYFVVFLVWSKAWSKNADHQH